MGQLLTTLEITRISWKAGFSEMQPPKAQWVPERDMPSLEGKVVLVTGANGGIGKETARMAALKGARVYLAGRSLSKINVAISEILTGHSEVPASRLIPLQLDLAELASIKHAADEFLGKENSLDILWNNAGVMACPVDMLTKDGYDAQWGTNVLGHFYLSKLLMPALLVAAAGSSSTSGARIVHTSSSSSAGGAIDFQTFEDSTVPGKRKTKSTAVLYAQSKLGNVLIAKEFARRYADRGIVSSSLNPGNINTDLQRHIGGETSFSKMMRRMFLFPVSLGATTQLYAGTAPEAKEQNGEYFVPWARIGKPNRIALDVALAEKVWEWCEEQVKGM